MDLDVRLFGGLVSLPDGGCKHLLTLNLIGDFLGRFVELSLPGRFRVRLCGLQDYRLDRILLGRVQPDELFLQRLVDLFDDLKRLARGFGLDLECFRLTNGGEL